MRQGELNNFGAKIRELRTKAGLTQSQLAGAVGVDSSYLSKIEKGVSPPPAGEIVIRLAEALHSSKDQLMALAGRIPSDVLQALRERSVREFGPRLRELRIQVGMSQDELARKAGIDHTYLSKIEGGKKQPPSEEATARLAEALNTSKSDLLCLAGRDHPLNKREGVVHMPRLSAKSSIVRMLGRPWVRAAASAALTVVIVAVLLLFSSPVQALTITCPSLPSTGVLGSSYTFQVKVDIQDIDRLPLTSVNLDIYNAASPSTYRVT